VGGDTLKKIVGVKFKKTGKIYFFEPGKLHIRVGDHVIVDTAMGEDYGEVVIGNRQVEEEKIAAPLKRVIRIASQEDKKHYEENKRKEKEAYQICNEKIKKYKLDMNLTEVEYKFDNSKLLFYFTADGRVDFRELVKDLASIFKTRIELRQIGVRDEVKRIGGNGVCGRELCCCSFLSGFETVSIKMAKEQNISLNPSKISGNCGRLMCCLKYEQNVYEEKLKHLPKVGAIVKTPEGEGIVEAVETLKEIVRVKIKDDENDGGYLFKKYQANEIEILKNGQDDQNEKIIYKDLEELEEMHKKDKKNSERW